MIFPILFYEKKENFRRNQITKLNEELIELEKAETQEETLEELFDIIQVCISIISIYPNQLINSMCKKHYDKLIKIRKWKHNKNYVFSFQKIKSK